MTSPDILIIGSGMGGATLAAALAPSGKRIVILERGDWLADCPEARDPWAVFGSGHFSPKETWYDADGGTFTPNNYYYPGGNSKFYGAVLMRYRAEDFQPLRHMGGTAPGWPMSYDEFEPDYQAAEEMYEVRGRMGEDPTEPHHSRPYPFPPVPHEPDMLNLCNRLKALGLHPGPLPLGVDIDLWLKGGPLTFDGFPNTRGGKSDAETIGLAAALKHPNVTLITKAKVTRLIAEAGKITAVEYEQDGATLRISAPLVCLCAGAVKSACLLLASADSSHPTGLANSSDQVGRNFMNHNITAVLGVNPFRRNRSVYEKTIQMNDWYLTGGPKGEPLGNVQMLGRITGEIMAAESGLPLPISRWLADHSVHLMTMSEDLPNPESRVFLRDGKIVLKWQRSNWQAHVALNAKLKAVLKKAGWPLVLTKTFEKRTPSHQCGTARMGADPSTSVVNPFCRSHDLANLFIVDASVLPTSAAANPSLTVAALALRTARHILQAQE
ncbi:GMC oxidoreductase [Cypionkella psychrotolerans]|uniref:GMC oxidoreductase n=1 Tax=Cypionkella psychrotolerans TaxID=1678131 RepID=UPI0006B42BF2|nr:GMC family oxidoreductase [Cypionkella psychrotolerans]